MIRLEVLGKPVVKNGQREAKLYAKAVALLAYLALEGRTSRRKIAELLWVGAPDPLNNLSVTRGHILAELGEGALESDLETIALGSGVWCDALEWQRQPNEENWGLYKGEFLQDLRLREWKKGLGEEFEEWVEEKKLYYINQKVSRAGDLAQYYISNNELNKAKYWLEIANSEAELRENLIFQLFLVYKLLNLLNDFEFFYSILLKKLEIDHSSQFIKVIKEKYVIVNNSDLDDCLKFLISLNSKRKYQHENSNSLDHLNLSSNIPFIGRNEVFSELKKSQEFLKVILGEAGIGKTRLALEYFKDKKKLIILKGEKSMLFSPLSIVAECIKSLFSDPSTLWGLEKVWRIECFRLVGEIFANSNNKEINDSLLLQQITNEEGKFRFFEGLANAIKLGIGNNNGLILDDFHWFDSTTIEFLPILVKQLRNSNIPIVITSRIQDLYENKLAYDFIFHFFEKNEIFCCELDKFSREEVDEVVKYFELKSDHIVDFFTYSGGNIFYLLEIIKNFKEEDFNFDVKLNSLNKIVKKRIKNLKISTQNLLEVISLLGNNYTKKIINDVLSYSKEKFTRSFDEALRNDFLAVADEKIQFTHSVFSEILLGDLSEEKRKSIHKSIALVLENHSLFASEIATHFDLAGETEKAALWYLNSAKSFKHIFAYSEAINSTHKALNYEKKLINLIDICILSCEIYKTMNKNELWFAEINNLLILANNANDYNLFQVYNLEISDYYYRSGHYSKALQYTEKILNSKDFLVENLVRILMIHSGSIEKVFSAKKALLFLQRYSDKLKGISIDAKLAYYLSLSELSYDCNLLNLAKKYLKESFLLNKNKFFLTRYAQSLAILGLICEKKNHVKSSIILLKNSLIIFESIKNITLSVEVLLYLVKFNQKASLFYESKFYFEKLAKIYKERTNLRIDKEILELKSMYLQVE